MERRGLRSQLAASAAGAQPQGEVEVLVVEEDALVEAADRVEGEGASRAPHHRSAPRAAPPRWPPRAAPR